MRLATYSPVQWLRRWLFWSHRWLGVLTCLLCAMWFFSGLVMLYVPYPAWRDAERLSALPRLDAAKINVTPGEALAAVNLARVPTVFRLEMWGDEPVYRIVDFGKPTSVSALDGRLIASVDTNAAAERLQRIFPDSPVSHARTIQQDQWTVSGLFSPHRPLHVFELADGLGTEIYVSSKTGEIVQNTTRSERVWNWLGSVPHWIYFTVIRSDPPLWRQVIMWTAGPAAIGAVLGIWIGVLRMRLRKRYASGRITPYRGWMRWHHLSGLAGGVFVVTWLVSGWLSVSPLGLIGGLSIGPDDLARYYGAGRPAFVATLPTLRAAVDADTKELSFSWVEGAPIIIADDGAAKRVLDAGSGEAADLAEQRLKTAAAVVMPGANIASVQRLDAPDLYWFSHLAQRPLPVLRIMFDDPASTWLMIDLTTGRIVGALAHGDRVYRWLFGFVHQYDLPWLLERPLLRQALIWLLSMLGMAVSLTGVVLAYRMLRLR
ncbi:PepSY domain-containing protein [Hyphomicrobium sulfonivorans]|nr:PepSY domain-containing protein [Hyphomicrobium sulfonivorans]